MKIILVDKLYYPYSGVQDYFFDLVKVLQQHGHHVIPYDGYQRIAIDTFDTSALQKTISKKTIWQAINALYSFRANRAFGKLLDEEKPDIVHINNIHHNISPSLLYEANKRKIPSIYHLHDYKLVCPTYRLYRKGNICKECEHGKYFQLVKNRCFLHDCYNFKENIFLFIEAIFYKYIMCVHQMVDVFIVSSNYVKSIYEDMGFNGNIQVIPYFVFPSFFLEKKAKKVIKTGIYFGRIVPEKGVLGLIQASSSLNIDIQIAGVGPQLSELKDYCLTNAIQNVSFTGFLTKHELGRHICNADVTIVPSLWPEPFGKTIIESFSVGRPVIASNNGGIPELVRHKENGLLYDSRDKNGLRNALREFLMLSKQRNAELEKHAYKTWKERYNPDIHYKKLMGLYMSLINKRSS